MGPLKWMTDEIIKTMCNQACIDFVRKVLTEKDVRGKSVIEVGSLDVNGSVRPVVELLQPAKYTGVDIKKGPGVDQICGANDLSAQFGNEVFDLLISTELIEHVRDWKRAIHNFKNILKPKGIILITTRSFGYSYHGYPFDFWRYEMKDMQILFSDFVITNIEKDSLRPGVFIKAWKSFPFSENNLLDYSLYSIIKCKRSPRINTVDIAMFQIYYFIRYLLSAILPEFLKRIIKKWVINNHTPQR